MLKSFFHEMLDLNPTFRSFIGDKSTNGEYENTASVEYKEAYKKILMKYKNMLDKSRKTIDLDTFTLYWLIDSSLEGLKYDIDWMNITSYDNPILNFVIDDSFFYPLKTPRDISDLISRTRKRIIYIKNVMNIMQDGTGKDLTIPKIICKKMIRQISLLLKNQSYYIRFPRYLEKHKEEYMLVIDTEYVPFLYEFLEFLKKYVHSCRNSIGLCYVKDGKEIYANIVKESTTLDMTPKDVFEYGKTELKNHYKELLSIKPALLRSLGYKMNTNEKMISNQELFKRIKAKDSEYFDTSNEIVNAYKMAQEKIRKNIIPKLFGHNVQKYNIKKIPKLIEDSSTTAYYYPPSMKSNRRGTVFINANSIRAHPKYTINTLSLHEGAPGHHYQYQFMKQHHFPLYRIYSGDNDAYTEGWALYCERFINTSDPKEVFGRWIYSMLRTVRLIIDTGIHYYGWSYKRALEYMIRHVPLSKEELKNELERYICDPGQAISYKIGEQFFITEKENYLKHGLGTIKDFHKEILDCGPLPLEVLKYKLRNRLICSG